MKFVFVVNSHTTFLSTLGVIDFLKIAEKSVVILKVRSYKNIFYNERFESFDVDDEYSKCTHFFSQSKKTQKTIIKEVDKILEFINSEYCLFVPHLGHAMFMLLYTNSKCKEVSYIQEGGIIYQGAFTNQLNPRLLVKVLYNCLFKLNTFRLWKPCPWYLSGTLYKQKRLESYAINNMIFKNLSSNNHIIKWPNIQIESKVQDDSHIFVFDGYVVNGMIEKDFYKELCVQLIVDYCTNYSYIKFHPNQTEEEKEFILKEFSTKGVGYEVLAQDIPLELVLTSRKRLHVFGMGSSLLFYARDLGHNVICKDKWLLKSPKYTEYHNGKKNLLFDELYGE